MSGGGGGGTGDDVSIGSSEGEGQGRRGGGDAAEDDAGGDAAAGLGSDATPAAAKKRKYRPPASAAVEEEGEEAEGGGYPAISRIRVRLTRVGSSTPSMYPSAADFAAMTASSAAAAAAALTPEEGYDADFAASLHEAALAASAAADAPVSSEPFEFELPAADLARSGPSRGTILRAAALGLSASRYLEILASGVDPASPEGESAGPLLVPDSPEAAREEKVRAACTGQDVREGMPPASPLLSVPITPL
jgi:hypothetical protein